MSKTDFDLAVNLQIRGLKQTHGLKAGLAIPPAPARHMQNIPGTTPNEKRVSPFDANRVGSHVQACSNKHTCLFPQIAAIGVLTSNKEGKVICEIAGGAVGGAGVGAILG